MFTLNGENRTNLITSVINTPTVIVLDPNEGFLFLTDSGTRSFRTSRFYKVKVFEVCLIFEKKV